jgi:iron complex transport system substrate-binding protein
MTQRIQRLSIISAIILTICLCACSRSGANGGSAIGEIIYQPEHAQCFALRGNSRGETVLEVYNPWQSETSADTSRIVIPRGGFHRMVCMSTTHLAYLDEIDELARVVGVSGMKYISIPAVTARRDSLADVGYDAAMDYETLLSIKPDVVLIYGVGARSTIEAKLRELQLPYVYIADFVEQDPLGRAEWLVAFGALAGCRGAAAERYTEIAKAYETRREEYAADTTAAPKVMLNAPYASSWFMPSVKSEISRLIDDAGGRYIYRDNTAVGAAPIDMEQAVMLLQSADLWLNTGQYNSLAALRDAAPNAEFSGPVFNHRGSFFESGMVHPELILEDLHTIFKGGDTSSLHYYFRLQ